MRCLSRLIEPTQGEILVDGVDVMGMDTATLRTLRRHHMSMVFQRFGLFPHRRVLENVAYGLEVQGMERVARLNKAQEVLELVGLRGWGQKYPHELSGWHATTGRIGAGIGSLFPKFCFVMSRLVP